MRKFLPILLISTPMLAYNIGDRAIGMAGAYTALANDSSATWYNPAGLVHIPAHTLTVSATAYQHKQHVLTNFLQLQEADANHNADLRSASTDVFPSTMIYAKTFGKGSVKNALAISILVPDSEKNKGVVELNSAEDAHFVTFETEENFRDYRMGPSYAIGSSTFSVGLSAFLRYYDKNHTYNLYEDTQVTGQTKHITARNFTETYRNLSFVPRLGVQYQASPSVTIGLMGAPPSTRIGGQTNVNRVITTAGAETIGGADTHEQEHKTASLSTFLNTPWRARVGLGYQATGSFAIELSAEVSGKINPYLDRTPLADDSSGFEQNIFSKKLGYDVNLGIEYYLSPTFQLRAGGFTRFSHHGKFSSVLEEATDNNEAGDHYEDLIGASIGLGQKTSKGSVSYTLSAVQGKGQALAIYTVTPHSSITYSSGDTVHTKSVRIIDTSSFEITLFISGTLESQPEKKSEKEAKEPAKEG